MIDYIKTKWTRFKRAWRANPPKVDIRFIPKE